LDEIFESKDVATKMFFKYKLHIIKMIENDNVIKHIHTFKALLEQLSITRSLATNDETIISMM
jgi:hypothetical protein